MHDAHLGVEIEALTIGILLGDLPEMREAVDELVGAVNRDFELLTANLVGFWPLFVVFFKDL